MNGTDNALVKMRSCINVIATSMSMSHTYICTYVVINHNFSNINRQIV